MGAVHTQTHILRCVQALFKKYKSKIKRINKLKKKKIEGMPTSALIQSYKENKVCSLNKKVGRSRPSKTLLFLLYHRFHMTHKGTAGHTMDVLWQWKHLFQHSNSSYANLSIIHISPNNEKSEGLDIRCLRTVKKRVINRFPTAFTHI